jgi:hypothetical protein
MLAAQKSPGKTKPASSQGSSKYFSQITQIDRLMDHADPASHHRAAHQTSDGGFITISLIDGSLTLITKTTGAGRKLWERSFGSKDLNLSIEEGCFGTDVQQTPDGGYIATGQISENRISKLWVVRLNDEGKTVWEKRYGEMDMGNDYMGLHGNTIVQNTDGTCLIAVGTVSCKFILLMKINSMGEMVWKRRLLDARSGVAAERSVWIVGQDSGYLMAYHIGKFSIDKHSGFRVMRLDDKGDTIWSTDVTPRFGKESLQILHSLIATADGGFAVFTNVAESFLFSQFGAGRVAKFSRDGKPQWSSMPKFLNKKAVPRINYGGLIELPNGGYAIGTTFVTGDDHGQITAVLFARMDNSGNIIGARIYGTMGPAGSGHECQSIDMTRDGGFIVAGKYNISNNPGIITKYGAWLLKLDSDGNNPSERQLSGIPIGSKITNYKDSNAQSD